MKTWIDKESGNFWITDKMKKDFDKADDDFFEMLFYGNPTPHPNPAEPGNFKNNKTMSETMILPESFADLLSHTNTKSIDDLIDLHFGGIAETKEMKDKLRVFAVQSMLLYQTNIDEANQSEIAEQVKVGLTQQHQQEMQSAIDSDKAIAAEAEANGKDAFSQFALDDQPLYIQQVDESTSLPGMSNEGKAIPHVVTEQDAANNPDLAAEGIQPGDQIDIPAEGIVPPSSSENPILH
jgi:hypothetical protein